MALGHRNELKLKCELMMQRQRSYSHILNAYFYKFKIQLKHRSIFEALHARVNWFETMKHNGFRLQSYEN